MHLMAGYVTLRGYAVMLSPSGGWVMVDVGAHPWVTIVIYVLNLP